MSNSRCGSLRPPAFAFAFSSRASFFSVRRRPDRRREVGEQHAPAAQLAPQRRHVAAAVVLERAGEVAPAHLAVVDDDVPQAVVLAQAALDGERAGRRQRHVQRLAGGGERGARSLEDARQPGQRERVGRGAGKAQRGPRDVEHEPHRHRLPVAGDERERAARLEAPLQRRAVVATLEVDPQAAGGRAGAALRRRRLLVGAHPGLDVELQRRVLVEHLARADAQAVERRQAARALLRRRLIGLGEVPGAAPLGVAHRAHVEAGDLERAHVHRLAAARLPDRRVRQLQLDAVRVDEVRLLAPPGRAHEQVAGREAQAAEQVDARRAFAVAREAHLALRGTGQRPLQRPDEEGPAGQLAAGDDQRQHGERAEQPAQHPGAVARSPAVAPRGRRRGGRRRRRHLTLGGGIGHVVGGVLRNEPGRETASGCCDGGDRGCPAPPRLSAAAAGRRRGRPAGL